MTLSELKVIKQPRCFLKVDIEAMVWYSNMQTVSITNEIISQLHFSKTHVSPMKVMTIRRLKLSACILLAKLTHKVLLKHLIDYVQL